MPGLQLPSPEMRESFLTAMAEFAAEARGAADDDTMIGHEIRTHGDTYSTETGFASFVESLRADSLEETPRREGWVPCTTWWWVGDEGYLGRIALRHRLTEDLRRVGGHIGYDVRPMARRRGHATAMLRAVLPLAAEREITSALVTCDTDNVASATVIAANGGVLENELDGKLRYWVPTA